MKIPDDFIKKIIDLISTAKLIDAILLLKDFSYDIDLPLYKQMVMLSFEYHELINGVLGGRISKEEEMIEKRRLVHMILNICLV